MIFSAHQALVRNISDYGEYLSSDKALRKLQDEELRRLKKSGKIVIRQTLLVLTPPLPISSVTLVNLKTKQTVPVTQPIEYDPNYGITTMAPPGPSREHLCIRNDIGALTLTHAEYLCLGVKGIEAEIGDDRNFLAVVCAGVDRQPKMMCAALAEDDHPDVNTTTLRRGYYHSLCGQSGGCVLAVSTKGELITSSHGRYIFLGPHGGGMANRNRFAAIRRDALDWAPSAVSSLPRNYGAWKVGHQLVKDSHQSTVKLLNAKGQVPDLALSNDLRLCSEDTKSSVNPRIAELRNTSNPPWSSISSSNCNSSKRIQS